VPQGWGPWHLSGQFRYGTAQKTKAFNGSTTLIVPAGTTLIATTSNNEKIRDDHWLVDFAVGRDFGLGNGNAQWKLGLRVADLRAKLTASGSVSTTPIASGPFNTQQVATFVGVGPRLGVDGSTQLGGGWSLDWLGGVAVLFGERQTTQTSFPTPIGGGVFAPITSGQATSNTTAVFNVDGQAGLSYWFSPTFKITASYRVDAYFSALKTIKPGTANNTFTNVDQIYNGPMLRLTSSF
jgi:hypothetical protein